MNKETKSEGPQLLFSNLKIVEDKLKMYATELENNAIENIKFRPTIHDLTIITAMWHVRNVASVINKISNFGYFGVSLRTVYDEFDSSANFILCKMFVNDERYKKFDNVINEIINAKCIVNKLLSFKKK